MERYLYTTFKLYKNSFSRQRARLEVLAIQKQIDGKRVEKVLQKIGFLLFFFNNKNVFHYMFARFFFLIQLHAIWNFAAYKHKV